MAWICKICSTENDDSRHSCIVCDTPMSIKLKRDYEIRLKAVRAKRVDRILGQKVLPLMRAILLLCIVTVSLCMTLMLIEKVRDGSISDIQYAFSHFAKHAFDNIKQPFMTAFSSLAFNAMERPLRQLSYASAAMLQKWGDSFSDVPVVISGMMSYITKRR